MTYELATKLLDQAEELINTHEAQESLLEALDQAEKLLPEDVSVLCRSARVLFRYGALNGKGRFFLLALDKLKLAEEKNPLFFDTTSMWWQLWGNILVQLGKFVDDSLLFEQAIEKYARASRVASEKNLELYWDWADAWILLGQQSGELTDFQQGLIKYAQVFKEGLSSSFFRLDYGQALASYGKLTGDPSFLEEALSLFKTVIADTYNHSEEPSAIHIYAWRKFVSAMKSRYQLTYFKEHFDDADTAFREAILTTPKNGDLWLDWGELYLQAGWLKRDLKLIETGLEKLTSSKIKESDPIKVSIMLSIGLTILGLFLENLKLLKDARERVQAALKVFAHHPKLGFASAFVDLGFGLYFSDIALLAKTAHHFEECIQEEADSAENWHALYQTYLAWGLIQNDTSLMQKGVQAIARLCDLRPFSPLHLNERGVALLRLKQCENDKESAQGYLEEAIQCFQRAWELSEDDETLYNWGCAFDLLGDITADEEDYSKAIDLLTKAFERKNTDLQIRYHLGLAFSHLGELTLNAECLAQAVDLLDSVAKVDQEDEVVWCDLGYAYLNLAELIMDSINPEEGLRMRKEAENALMRSVELGSGDACYHLACLYSLSGMNEAALHYLKKTQACNLLPSREDLEHDEWLEGIRKTEAFQDFLTQDQDG